MYKARNTGTIYRRKHWDDEVYKNIDFLAIKLAFLSLGPIQRIACSKRIH
jgi:hypothetical protein